MFAVRATYHTTLRASPMQLVFGRYAILNIKHVADWEHIWQRKQLQINHNNMRENMRRNNHQYKVGDKILVKRKKNSKQELEFMGPLPITQINDNDTVCFQKVIINDATIILRILVASLVILFWKRTMSLSFICVMGNGPMNYNSCLELFLRLTRIFSPTLYW